jgi:multidrug resistance protein, MATE family
MIEKLSPSSSVARGSLGELLRLAWPFVLSQSFLTLQLILDRILLSRAAGAAVGASMAAGMLWWVLIALLTNTAGYATTFVAQYTGAGQPRHVGAIIWQALYFSVGSGLAFLLLIPLAGPIIDLIGHETRLRDLEAAYFRCLCFAALPALITASASAFFAGRGDSRTVLLINAAGLVVNGVCAFAWINGLWGFPRLGIVGAGWATVVGSTGSAVMAMALMLRRPHRLAHATWDGRAFDGALFRRLMRFGLPNGIFQALDGLGYTCFLIFVGLMGPEYLAAASIAFSINLVAFLPILGIGQAIEVLVGQRLGEDRPDLAERSTWVGLGVALITTGTLALTFVLLPGPLIALFASQEPGVGWEQIGPLVPGLLHFVAVYCLFDSANLVFSNALRGAGDTRFVTWVAVALSWPVMVLPTWAAWYFGWGLYWAFSFATGYIVALAVTFLLRFRGGKWRSMRVIETQNLATEVTENTESKYH